MLEKLLKAVKSSNKKRGRNITVGVVIGFLLSCTAVMGADEYLWIKNDNKKIEFNNAGEWNGNTYMNNIGLSLAGSSGLELSGSGRGIYAAVSTEKKDETHEGFIQRSGVGIEATSNTGNIINTGIIDSSAGPIRVGENLSIGNIINTGMLISSSYGIFTASSSKVNKIENTGIIYSSRNAIENGEKNRAVNYGILIGSVNRVKFENNGLIFKITGKTYSAETADFENFGTISEKDGYRIINAKAEGSGKDDITGTESITIENGILKYNDSSNQPQEEKISSNKKYILNGITDTLLVKGNNNKLSNSAINAYTTAVVFDEAGGELTLTGTTVNGGINKILSSSSVGDAITGGAGNDVLVLQSSRVTGNIDLGEGDNTIKGGDGTVIVGDIKNTEGKKNNLAFGNNVSIYGKIDLKAEENKLTFGNNIYIKGDISTGTNGVDFKSGSKTKLDGKVNFTTAKDTFEVGEKSVINKDIDMKDEDDKLVIGAGSIVNGTLDGGDGTDILQFGTVQVTRASNTNETINIFKDITGFENINVGANVTFASYLTLAGTEKIILEKNGVLILSLSVNPNNEPGESEKKITRHALYNKGEIIVSSTGGKVLLDLDSPKGKEVISFGSTVLDSSIVPGNNETLDITSKVHTIMQGEEPNEVVLTLRWNIPEILKYDGLNGVYHGIGSVNDLIGNFNIKSDEQLTTFIGYLNNIYAGSPYSYSSELSRKSAGMFRDIVTENQFKANTGKWMIYGGLTHVDGGTKDTYYGKGYYTYDIGSSDIDGDTKITGAYMLGEYGVSDTLTSGVVIGGNKLKSDLSNGSKVDGSALYLGAYAKKYIGNLKVTAGAGFQYGDYDADRLAINKLASEEAKPVMEYSDNYIDMTYDIYLNGRYSHNIGENLFLEPYGTLSYTYIDQDGADEGSKVLGIETDSKSFDYTTAKVGVDLKKVIPHEKGKSTLSAGVSYTRILDGADEEHITGRFKGGSDFDILVAHKNEHSIGLNAKYALELENGILFDVKGTYSVERDSHNQSGKNKTKGEWIVGAGLGYKF